MTIPARQKIVLLGLMGRMRVAGAVWQTLHYLLGLQNLGYEPYYIEAHGALPWAFQDSEAAAAEFVASVLRRFDLGDRWAFHALGGSGAYYGMSEHQVHRLYESAEAILNLHGGTIPTPEQSAGGRLVYIDTDPVAVQVQIHQRNASTAEILQQHCALFTFAENYGNSDCKLPLSTEFRFKPTRQPVVLDLWAFNAESPIDAFTTVGNWKQLKRVIEYDGEEYQWSKHLEFLKFIDLPRRSAQPLELALSSCDDASRELLLSYGWRVRDGLGFSQDLNAYREYVRRSRAEFTVAKDQNIRLRTGWFSDRSATYLAAGRPVLTQETGFGNILPTGEGLHRFSDMDEAVSGIESINSQYERNCERAAEIAREYFSHDIVLSRLLGDIGVTRRGLAQGERGTTANRTQKGTGESSIQEFCALCVPAHAPFEGRSVPLSKAKGRRAGSRQHPPDEIAVNLVGDFSGHTGMSATADGYLRALEYATVNVTAIDVSSRARAAATSVRSGGQLRPADVSNTRRTAINLICCEVASHFSVRSRLGNDFFRGGYNIGIWLWESENFPSEWYDRFAYYDEIWAPTSFVASALSPVSPIPIVRMPFVLEPETAGSRVAGRRSLGAGEDEVVYLFAFNFHSRIQRKNPMAVIQAFKQAFTAGEHARLVIKCSNASFSAGDFLEMKRQAEGHRINICDGDWSKEEMSNVTAACDCYVSLHRAEGVGVTISDAMAAGKPAVATGWSGNMDFMTVANSFPVRYRLAELDTGVAHFRAGEKWAEASIDHAAEIMRYVFDHPDEGARRGAIAATDIRRSYSKQAVGALIATRLALISRFGKFQALRDYLAKGVAGAPASMDEFSDLGKYLPEAHLRYEALKRELRRIVRSRVPRTATLIVVSRGDDELLNLDHRRSRHFPGDTNSGYAGYHPKDSAAAIQELERVRAEGGNFLLFPQTAFWWLDYYSEFREHLLTHYTLAHRDESCVMFEL